MEGDVDTGIAPRIFLHNQALATPMARKRDLPWLNPSFDHVHQQQRSHHWHMGSGIPAPNNSNSWNPKMWDWDSLKFAAKPSEDAPEGLCINGSGAEQREKGRESGKAAPLCKGVEVEDDNLALILGGGAYAVEELAVRPNKRVRSGSPGSSASYPMCQVDDCRADLSSAKDYHRRHKVCEIHSKTAKAPVGKQVQRFCQQCSRFHPLMEFDEGKRSCRRRLAGHNRRRRKTQPEDASSNILVPESQDGKASKAADIVNLCTILARLQGNIAGKPTSTETPLDRDRLIQILNKIGSMPPSNDSSNTQVHRGFDLNVSQPPPQNSSELKPQESGSQNTPSTMNLLAILSGSLASSDPDALATLSQESSDGNGISRSREAHMVPPFGRGESDCNASSQLNSSIPIIPLQLFSSTDDDSPPNLGSAIKYPSSESSNPIEDRSPSCSPPIEKRLFPLQSACKKDESLSICREDQATAEASTTRDWVTPLELFNGPDRKLDNQTVHNLPYSGSYSSSSGSDRTPSDSNCDFQDLTGRIIFKLFDKDPSNLPETLRSEIVNWLSHSPSEIESYIRPGCVVLCVYLCMKSIAWDELEEDFYQRVGSLVNCSDSGFWKNARFSVRTNRQLASHKDGKIHLCKSWRTLSAPELTFVSPIAIVSGQETTLVLRGRNLTVPGTKIHCSYKGGYSSKEVPGTTHPGTIYDASSLESFILPKAPYSYGRYFIEVDNGFKGNSFPIIIADATICKEVRSLESLFDEDVGSLDGISQDLCTENRRPHLREDAIHFLNELGWLFQRKNHPDPSSTEFSTSRFKYLFMFSVERDFSALVRTLLDILVKRCHGGNSMLLESLELLSELQLLSRAVKKKCRKMVQLLLDFSVKNSTTEDSIVYLFPPDSRGSGGLTPLHLAASMQDAEDMVDALTNDPQEIGLNSWASLLDDSGQSPSAYAASRNNHSYNILVASKLADKKNSQVSIMVLQEETSMGQLWIDAESQMKHGNACGPAALEITSCAHCALAEYRLVRINRGRGLLQRPYVHSILAIASVCVCVCLFLRGAPFVGSIAPFKWENLDFGPR